MVHTDLNRCDIRPGQSLVGASFKLAQPTQYIEGTAKDEHYYVQLSESPNYAVALALPSFHEDAQKMKNHDVLQEVGPIGVIFWGSTERASHLGDFKNENSPVYREIMDNHASLSVELLKIVRG